MKEINKFINGANFDKSVKNTGSKSVYIERQIEKFKQKFISRLEKEVPENGIFTTVSEEINDKKFSCEYSKEQTSDKKDKRVLKLSSKDIKSDKEPPTVLFEGTKSELIKIVREQNFSDLINSKSPESKNNGLFFNPSYAIINRKNNKQVSFGSNSEQNSEGKRNTIDEVKIKFQEVVDNPYCNDEVKEEYAKRLSILETLEKSDLSYERIKDIIDLFIQNTCSADEALKIALLNDEQYITFKQLPDILGVTLPYSDSADIASFDKGRYEKFLEIYKLKADENSFKDTLTQTYDSKVPIYSYYDYSKKYAQSLIPIFKTAVPVYNQSVELIENGIEPICLKNLANIILNDTQKQRVKLLNDERIVPTEELISLKDDKIFDLSIDLYKNVDNTTVDSAVSKAKKYSLNYKTFDRFIETFKNASVSNKFVININKNYDGTLSYESKMLDAVELISQYEDVDYIRANDFIKKGISLNYIDDIINCDLNAAQFERALDLLNKKVPYACLIASDDNLYNSFIEKLQNGDKYSASKSVVEEYQSKLYENLIKQGHNSFNAVTLSKLYGKKLNRGCEILKQVPKSSYSIDELLDNKAYKRAMEVLSKKSKDISSTLTLNIIVLLNDYDYDKASKLFDNDIDINTISELATCDEEKYNNAITLIEKYNCLSSYIISQVLSMPKEKYEKFLYCLDKGFDVSLAHSILKFNDTEFKRALYLLNRGLAYFLLDEVLPHNDKVYNRILYLLDNGYDLKDCINIAIFDKHFIKAKDEIDSDQNEIRKLFNSEDYLAKLKKNSQGKYQQEIINILSPDNIFFKTKKSLLNSGLSEKEFLSSVQKFANSTFKLAYDTPNQYLSGIDTKYTDKINGKYPTLPDNVKKDQQGKIVNFFKSHMGEIIKALNYLDKDTVNQMMDKRTEKFELTLEELNALSTDNYKLLSDLIKCKSKNTGKALTANEKIQLSQICLIFQKSNLDTSKLKEMSETKVVDISQAKRIITEKILQNAGFSDDEISEFSDEDIKFNPEYMYTMLINEAEISKEDPDVETTFQFYKEIMKQKGMTRNHFIEVVLEGLSPQVSEILLDIYDHIDTYSDDQIKCALKNAITVCQRDTDLYVVVNHAAKGDFYEFITDESNKYGQANSNTKTVFEENSLNFDEWLNPTIEDIVFDLNNRPLKIKMWDRNPNEDLFIGNKTSCCTAIGTGANASATPAYLLSQSYNVVELFDDNNNAIGMSRIFMANIDGKPSVVMDNIELNQNFLKNINEKDKFTVRDNFFKYINNFAKTVTGDTNSQVYFSTNYLKVDASDLQEEEKNIDFIGDVSQDNIYLNCFKGWFNYKDIKDIPIMLYKVPRN